ncbi:thioredoxin domain-containing protein [Pseudogemmatithrix spongiicola]|uniref:Thioredoxin domain-containing protein n=1 Tax=Pseudogemmatithrix spongiicola TaxID=3062599 RepID=A0AA49K269_9BACT|nr:thioredoxin domain-containing protein [Gemmatimonadaceae bacterium 'strain 138']WKW15998.1 thioredoxin domain-containing protein [Gemmatimonadaceae bacterium 'strain 318']
MARKSSGSKNSFGAIVAVVAVVGVAAIGYVVSRPRAVQQIDPASLPRVAAAGILKGNPNAPVQVIEFADFECPACGNFAMVTAPDVMKRLVETGQVAFRFYDLPLEMHRNAVPAHNAAHCANEQGRFWEMADLIFAGQFDWNTQASRNPKRIFQGYADRLGLDVDKWSECVDSGRMLPQIFANREEAGRYRVRSTPTFVIGGQVVEGSIPYDEFKRYVDAALAQATTMAQPPRN